ncbi:very short patch repair endonuclease [Streptomyces sp. NPDC059896]|uniref:very short patch repair endonuclease n=1 Tax=Streptomyces sp. NPDC059896 TaxID=3346993 RepID=UPI0036547468
MAWEKGLVTEEPPAEGSWASSPSVRAVMRANRSRDTRPEVRLRSLLHKQGLRYRVAARPLPELRRTADLVFTKPKVAVFVDGCFWHGCSEHLRASHKNVEFWRSKIEGNQARDADTDRLLREAGWRVVRVWEHEAPDVAAARVISVVRASPPDRHESEQSASIMEK